MNASRFLVTGGAGFIGSHLAATLAHAGHSVTVFDNFSTAREENVRALPPDVTVTRGDIRDLDALRAAATGVDVIFHEAAIASVQRSLDDPTETLAVNVTGTQNVLEAARLSGVRRVVIASSSAVYGAATAMPLSEATPARPISLYGAHKLSGEHLCDVYTQALGLETVALRYFNVYGPRQDPTSEYSAVIPRFIARVRAGEAPTIYGDGEQSRDFVHISDVVRANLLAATANVAGSIFNIGSGQRASINEMLDLIGDVTGTRIEPQREPARVGDIRDSVADISHARDGLGFTPRVTLRDGLADLLGVRPLAPVV